MKSNHRILMIALAMACAAGTSAQTAGIAPSAAPSADQPVLKSTARRLQAVAANLQTAGGDYAYVSSRYSSDSVPPVVVKFGATDAAAIGAMEEDLTIMTHIIDRTLERIGENDVDERFGVKLYYTSGGKSVRALYLEGFGPLFMVKVNFPVHSPGAVEPKTAEEPEDSEWNRARRQVLGLDQQEKGMSLSSSAVPYEAGRVEVLKKELIEALKNAANMKGVKPEEHVNLSVFGSPAAGTAAAANSLPTPARVVTPRNPGAAVAGEGFGRGGGGSGGAGITITSPRAEPTIELARTASQGTVLTLRARKSDIDAAAKGALDTEAFAKKVTVNTYAGNGHGVTSVNSWIRSSSGMRTR